MPLLVSAQPQPRDHPVPGSEITNFNEEKFPAGFNDKQKLTELLQKAVDVIYPAKGFRYLGERRDFFHGHILYVLNDNGVPQSVAILYHTQEEAYDWYQFHPKSTYAYLDRQKRNWIQWLDRPEVIENANKYERTSYPAGLTGNIQEKWDAFVKETLPAQKKHFTIKEWMLDPQFFGGEIALSVNWRFYEVDKMPKDRNSNVINITLPKKKRPILLALKVTRIKKDGQLVLKSYDSLVYELAQFDKYLYPETPH